MKIANGHGAGSGSGAHAGSTAPIPSILLSEEQIQERVQELGSEISAYYTELKSGLLILVVLDGAMIFASDLMRRITIPFEVATIKCKSYKDGASTGDLKITQNAEQEKSLRQREILIVEDIIDSGLTIRRLLQYLPTSSSIRVVSLLAREGLDLTISSGDWIGFKIPPGFVFGYGLDDADGTERGLKDIWVR